MNVRRTHASTFGLTVLRSFCPIRCCGGNYMSDDRSIIYLRVAPERIADVNWIMEGYEHLALVTTEDPREGVVKLFGHTRYLQRRNGNN